MARSGATPVGTSILVDPLVERLSHHPTPAISGNGPRQRPWRYTGNGPAAERAGGCPYSAGAVRVGFEDADFLEQRVEPGCVVADDGGGAHGVVVGLQAGKLVVVGNEPQPAVEALIVVGVTSMEKHLLVPDDILQEFAVGERGPADIVRGEACQVEPVPREPFGMGSGMEKRAWRTQQTQMSFSRMMAARPDRAATVRSMWARSRASRDRNASAMEPVPGSGGESLGHPRRHVCRAQPLEFRRAESGLDRGDRCGEVIEAPESRPGQESGFVRGRLSTCAEIAHTNTGWNAGLTPPSSSQLFWFE